MAAATLRGLWAPCLVLSSWPGWNGGHEYPRAGVFTGRLPFPPSLIRPSSAWKGLDSRILPGEAPESPVERRTALGALQYPPEELEAGLPWSFVERLTTGLGNRWPPQRCRSGALFAGHATRMQPTHEEGRGQHASIWESWDGAWKRERPHPSGRPVNDSSQAAGDGLRRDEGRGTSSPLVCDSTSSPRPIDEVGRGDEVPQTSSGTRLGRGWDEGTRLVISISSCAPHGPLR